MTTTRPHLAQTETYDLPQDQKPNALTSGPNIAPSAPVWAPAPNPINSAMIFDLAMALVAGSGVGAKFRLADNSIMVSCIPETDVPINADIVRRGLDRVGSEYKRRGLTPDLARVVGIQQSLVILTALLNFQAGLSGGPVSRHLIDFDTAVADFQHTLRNLNSSAED